MNRDLQIDNMKGILIILVVIGHFLLPSASTRFITNIVYLIYAFHMPAFIMISGYFSKGIYRDGRLKWGRILRMAWLYVLFKMMVHVTEGLLAGKIPARIDFFHEAGAPWYLLALVLWYLFLPAVVTLKKTCGITATAVLILFAALVSGYVKGVGEFLALDRVLAFMPFFYLGYFCGERERQMFSADRPAGRTVIVLAGITAAIIFFGMYDYLIQFRRVVYGAAYWRFTEAIYPFAWLVRIGGYAVAFVLTMGLLTVLPHKKVRLLTRLGERTLPIYMLHRVIRDLTQYFGIYQLWNIHSKIQVLLVMAFCVALASLLGCRAVNQAFLWTAAVPERLMGKFQHKK